MWVDSEWSHGRWKGVADAVAHSESCWLLETFMYLGNVENICDLFSCFMTWQVC